MGKKALRELIEEMPKDERERLREYVEGISEGSIFWTEIRDDMSYCIPEAADEKGR